MSMQNDKQGPHYPPQPPFLSQNQERKGGEGGGRFSLPPAFSQNQERKGGVSEGRFSPPPASSQNWERKGGVSEGRFSPPPASSQNWERKGGEGEGRFSPLPASSQNWERKGGVSEGRFSPPPASSQNQERKGGVNEGRFSPPPASSQNQERKGGEGEGRFSPLPASSQNWERKGGEGEGRFSPPTASSQNWERKGGEGEGRFSPPTASSQNQERRGGDGGANNSNTSYSLPPTSPGTPEGSAPTPPVPPAPQTVAVKMPDTKPVVAYIIMGISILIYLLQAGSEYLLGYDLPATLGLKANELIMQGQFWRLITPVLLHGSILHLLVNMYALNSFGPNLEKSWGHWRFLALYLIGGLGGNVASFLFSTGYSLGSSTAIFGLLGAEGVFLYQNKKLFGKHAQQALANIISVAVLNLVIGFSMSNLIDNWGHLGGMLGGVLFSWFAGPILHVEGVFPSLKLVDGREAGDIWRAGIAVCVLFIGLTAVVIYLRGG